MQLPVRHNGSKIETTEGAVVADCANVWIAQEIVRILNSQPLLVYALRQYLNAGDKDSRQAASELAKLALNNV